MVNLKFGCIEVGKRWLGDECLTCPFLLMVDLKFGCIEVGKRWLEMVV
jgi:hypothetical protein